jgi:hypothetical protein
VRWKRKFHFETAGGLSLYVKRNERQGSGPSPTVLHRRTHESLKRSRILHSP